ncbi:hypothetical protein EA187_12600 [Lujinxingia sediminis]|uniref:AbiV family abortive infection protein n=1 Tax=Lujinxingia sediminis TaxID=2480984 RepID=A0ABY0CS66_9DELT|nr:DUF6624 domain-containing protein [Lujinxingia sediminis]RVU43659.1 hypothetical protein EA187_12600 [Lujinxingia sediminis]
MSSGRLEDRAARLLALAAADLTTREALLARGELFEGYHPEMRAVHEANALELEAMIDARGWPRTSEVGEDAAQAAFLVASHAISLPGLQRKALRLLEALAGNDARPREVAVLGDRIRFNEGRPQRYGAIIDWDAEGNLGPGPLEEPDEVEARRARVGMEPLCDVVARLERRANEDGERPPGEWVARRRAMHAFFVSVGYRR